MGLPSTTVVLAKAEAERPEARIGRDTTASWVSADRDDHQKRNAENSREHLRDLIDLLGYDEQCRISREGRRDRVGSFPGVSAADSGEDVSESSRTRASSETLQRCQVTSLLPLVCRQWSVMNTFIMPPAG